MPDFASPWIAVWFWITLAIGLVWLRRHLEVNRGGREHVLSDRDARSDSDWPSLSVLVAAKDEEQNIARCIEGLLAQDYPNLRVIIANDRSADRTPEIIDEYARRDPRLTAVHVTELPAGWFGKNNAMQHALGQATGELLCFSDADCSYDSPLLLRAAVSFARRENVEFLSVLPWLEARTLWEKMIQPVAGAIMVFWFPPRKVNDPNSSDAYANGAFMLMTRRAYEAIGGHAYARATLNEDMHMARQAKCVGVRLRVVQSDHLYRVRMYTGFKQIWRGWSRIFYGCFGTLPRLLVSVVMLSIFSISPYLALLASPLVGASGGWLAAAAAFAIAAQQSILLRFYALTGNAPGWALTYPVGAAICLGMTLNAMRRLAGKKTTWRGTAYAGGAQVKLPPELAKQPKS
jgi:chlorobactene glucosyltransferase